MHSTSGPHFADQSRTSLILPFKQGHLFIGVIPPAYSSFDLKSWSPKFCTRDTMSKFLREMQMVPILSIMTPQW